MQMQSAPFTFGSSIWEKIGGTVMNVARGGVGLFTKARGDQDNQLVQGAAPVNYANLAVYGTLAALALVIVTKKGK
jgi:hypothetical protein